MRSTSQGQCSRLNAPHFLNDSVIQPMGSPSLGVVPVLSLGQPYLVKGGRCQGAHPGRAAIKPQNLYATAILIGRSQP